MFWNDCYGCFTLSKTYESCCVTTALLRYVKFFTCCEKIYVKCMEIIYAKKQRNHDRDPDRYRAPKRFKSVDPTWPNHDASASSTGDTDDENDTGGWGKFSHGHISLSHQHWVRQVVCGGSFGIHCTQGPEALHKKCMRLASSRVRHLRPNDTKESMFFFLCRHFMFEILRKTKFKFEDSASQGRKEKINTDGVSFPLVDPVTQGPVTLGYDFSNTILQSRFLHSEARVARAELLDLVCDWLQLPKTIATYHVLAQMKWNFGQKLKTADGRVYWSTDTRYPHYGGTRRRKRRDILGLNRCFEMSVMDVLKWLL